MGSGAFDTLVERHRREIASYVARLIGSRDADDVCQETFLRAFRAFGRLGDGANARAWLYRIATNAALSHSRRHARARLRRGDVDVETLAAPEAVDRSETLRALARAIERLPAKQRAALLQRRYQGLGYDEIGLALGCSAESARANVYQAVKKLRAVLDKGERNGHDA